ncbi:MAG: biotin--[acetyl-CoA-carboxylase] ligase [Desulfurococcaceae archaeon]|nr:MAG: biotin--[acetyl-CoA-carboxylase] ligase [Desulfurococcaceae archaeon]
MEKLEEKLLEILMSNPDRYISGEQIARTIGTNRMEVKRLIKRLRKRGFVIISMPRIGYKLMVKGEFEHLHEILRESLPSRRTTGVLHLVTCTSTQDIAVSLVKVGVVEDLLVVCERQTRGRGRFGRHWSSDEGGLWFSITYPELAMGLIGVLNLGVGVAVASSIRSLYGVDALLKWPNDVLVGKKKIAGVLIEGVFGDSMSRVVIGVGVNVNNELPGDLRETATTLRDLKGHVLPRTPLMISIIRYLDEIIGDIMGGNADGVISRWKALTNMLGKDVKISKGGRTFYGVAVDIDRLGGLVVRLQSNELVTLYAGDVISIYI